VAIERRRKVSRGDRRAGKRRRTSARVGTVSECRSRSDASPVATPAGATKRTSDTRDLAGRIRTHGAWRAGRRGARATTVRGPV